MWKPRKILILLAVIVLAFPIFAANTAKAEEKKPDDLKTTTESGLYLPSRSWRGGMHYGSTEFKIETHAFLDLEYIDAERQGSRNGVSHFDNHHANVFFDAELRPNLRGHIEVEYEHSGESIDIDNAVMSWATTPWLTLDIGRFYTPFGIERFVWYSPINPLVSRPVAFQAIIPGSFYANGLMASGNVGPSEQLRLTYEVAATDGLGQSAAIKRRGSRQARDNNSSRAISGRVAVILWPWVEVGSSYHAQKYLDSGDEDLQFVGLDLSARWKGWELRAESVTASVERIAQDSGGAPVLDPSGNPTPLPDLDQNGWYAQLGYTFIWDRDLFPAVTLVTRYNSVDLDKEVTGNDDQKVLSLGVNVMIYDHFRAKVEYQQASEKGVAKDNDAFLGQFVMDF